jgi:transcriptional regulator with XRE-family HTH domain
MRVSTRKSRAKTGLGTIGHNPKKQPDLAPEQQAVIDLRRALGDISQQRLATMMGKSIVSVSRWENARPPSGLSLYELLLFAERRGQREIARVFATAIQEAGNPQKAVWTDLDREFAFAAVIHNLSRNAHIAPAYIRYKKELQGLIEAHALLIEAAHDGAILHPDTPLDTVEFDQAMLERMYRDALEK